MINLPDIADSQIGCRQCVVEIDGRQDVPASCITPAEEGMVVRTRTARVEHLRRLAAELTLAAHPGDCSSCPKYGRCEFQSLVQLLGVSNARLRKRHRSLPVDSGNPLFLYDPGRCVLCGRCVRACRELPGKSKYSLPLQLDDVARDFPDLKIVAFHMGYPYCDDLNMVAMGHPNVYPCLSLLLSWALNAPRKFARILGEALRWVGPDRIIWGTDTPGFGFAVKFSVLGLREFQIPEDMQKDYGYPEITDEDRRKIFGGNLAGLLGIDASVRRVKKG